METISGLRNTSRLVHIINDLLSNGVGDEPITILVFIDKAEIDLMLRVLTIFYNGNDEFIQIYQNGRIYIHNKLMFVCRIVGNEVGILGYTFDTKVMMSVRAQMLYDYFNTLRKYDIKASEGPL